ncbi:glycosyltransferase family 25 protein [Ruegeria sp.]|uniref:glycosyltransferase family 25 protein n=1 Tax=Ruegeria sp. TaxID=1879320 RepID=UPI002313CF08|nr:glycosyltransferase family 25 protein [Ruegeria sp.]MDA7966102.1 glycosyltransferase family 25 protein [Ruegeria sp.]
MTVTTYLISLPRAEKRRVLMLETLAEAGIDAVIVDAIDAKETPKDVLLQSCQAEGPWGVFHLGNMACTMSHALVWEQFLQGDDDHAVILEDDVFLSPELKLWLSDLNWWPQGCDLVNLEFWVSNSLRVMLGTRPTAHLGRDVTPMLSRNPGSAGYIVTREGARRLLDARPFDVPIDQLLFNPLVSRLAVELNPHQVSPALVRQGNAPEGELSMLGGRTRPSGAAYRRQKLRRGWAELRAVPLHLFHFLSGKARMRRVEYQNTTLADPIPETVDRANPTHQ